MALSAPSIQIERNVALPQEMAKPSPLQDVRKPSQSSLLHFMLLLPPFPPPPSFKKQHPASSKDIRQL